MSKSNFSPISFVLVLFFLLYACTPSVAPSPTEAPLDKPTAINIPTDTLELAATLTQTQTPKPTETATLEPTATRPPGPVEVTIWYSYSPGGAEEIAFINVVKQVREDLPDYTIRLLRVPFAEIFEKYREEVTAGGGPDMYIAPNDILGNDVRSGLISDITDLAKGKLDSYDEQALQGMTVDGRLYGIPMTYKAVVFWYNNSLLKEPPKTTDELKALMESGTPVAITYSCFHHFGFFGSFGGQLFDDNWKFTADKGGFAEGMAYLAELYKISSANGWPKDEGAGLGRFRLGKVVAITNGNWAMGDYRQKLGNKLSVAPLPAGPGGAATPLLGVDGFYINPNSPYKDVDLEVALQFTNLASQTEMMNRAGFVPVRSDVAITDPLIQGLIDAFQNGYLRPQVPQMDNYWANFCATNDIFELNAPAADWVKLANDNANK